MMIRYAGAVAVWFGLVLGLGAGSSLHAEPAGQTVAAKDPAAMVQTLTGMGFSAELGTDNVGDPLIVSREQWGLFTVLFTGCDSVTHDECDTIRLQIGFDREQPWTAQDALALSRDMRFLAARLDEDGDPFLHWDLFLGEGIPEAVFVRNVAYFRDSVLRAHDIVFAEELAARRSQGD